MSAKKLLCSGLLALGAILVFSTAQAQTQQVPPMDLQLGLISLPASSPVQIAEMKVTYRFDQIGTGKSTQEVPVQMTYRLHNPDDKAHDLEIEIPTAGQEGQAPQITTVYINGKEQLLPGTQDLVSYGPYRSIQATLVTASMPKDSDLIVDIRALQPLDGENVPFFFSTGRAWSGSIGQGNLEAIFPFTVANWNVIMRSQTDSQPIPLTYSGKSAAWNFSDLPLQSAQDVYWQIADLQAMSYYEQGLDRWRTDNNDSEAYTMMRRAMLDMIPCHGRQMPAASWWDNNYETVTVGLISSSGLSPEDQLIKAMEYWSGGWTVPQGEDAECLAHEWRPDRYRTALHEIWAMPPDQRSEAINQALEKHYNFLRKLVAVKGANSLQDDPQNIPSTDPLNDSKLSAADRQLLALWDERFASPANVSANAQGQGESALAGKSTTSTSSTIGQLLQKLPKLSFGTQVIIFALLALLVLIIIGYIIFKWQETPTVPPRPTIDATKTPTVPLMGMGLNNKVNLAEAPPVVMPKTNEPEDVLARPTEDKNKVSTLPTPPPVPPLPNKAPMFTPQVIKPKAPAPSPKPSTPTPPNQNVNTNQPKPVSPPPVPPPIVPPATDKSDKPKEPPLSI